MSHGVAEMKWVDLGILNPPIYEREHIKPDVHRAESTRKVSMSGRGVKDGDRFAGRGASPLAGTRGAREVSAAGDGDSIRKADGGFMMPVELSSAPGEGFTSRLFIPQVGKVPSGAPVGKEERRRRSSP